MNRGRTWNPGTRGNVPLADLSKISSKTLLLSVSGDKDRIARDTDAKRIYYESKNVSSDNKDFITLISDDHGTPPLIAHHGAPSASDHVYDNGETSEEIRAFRERIKERVREQQNGIDEEISHDHLLMRWISTVHGNYLMDFVMPLSTERTANMHWAIHRSNEIWVSGVMAFR